MQPEVTVGIRVPHELFVGGATALRRSVADVEAAGIDRVCVGDHIAFHGGRGFDGLVQATALAALCDLEVQTAVYLLPLRHPVPVARQVLSLALLSGGRFVFGVGIGGEDPAEVAMCGVDPSTRGRRMDESLGIVRDLLAGRVVDRAGGFYELDAVRMTPTPAAPVPVTVGGRSAAALRRAGVMSEGYLALWTTPQRWKESIRIVEGHARDAGRDGVAWRHGLQVWCGVANSAARARLLVADAMESLYRIAFAKFEKYTPYGTPEDVANALRPYLSAGCREFNLIPIAAHPDEAIAGVGEVRRLLQITDG
ncbi:LLM class flavin-dependent oxidoreductase [Mycolicibacter senuensis]|uniref:LLM class flavin-dependent oxidoreductase n=1 Tax=Mycolicibacter senuensis TaxID=386913 RepID=UPI000DCF377B|nr:LLM class flavin-dependent oxidoreductase [Mycolicibacter senuensis]RAV01814.1 LLM class flavin-dependent oxidoreductase [Mycolicibacter senuensis]